MKNSYIAVGVLVIVIVLAFVIGKKETEAPQLSGNEDFSTTTVPLTDGSYKIDAGASTVKWVMERADGTDEEGTVGLKSGNATVLGSVVTGGIFVLDNGGIVYKGVPAESTFTITAVEPMSKYNLETVGQNKYLVSGVLKAGIVEKELSFPATITSVSGGTLRAESYFVLNSTAWNMAQTATKDFVEITLDLKAIKE